MLRTCLLTAVLAALAVADTITVDLATCSGTPQLYSQGLLYGISGTNTPPQSYYSALKTNYESAGGAQFDTSPAGYASNISSYTYRFSTAVDAFKRIRANHGVMIVKLADLWGADFTQPSNFKYPGDNGDWTLYDAFLQRVISDVKANGMAVPYATQLELWNEPDINFGKRSQSQYNAMFVRGVKTLRAAFGKNTAAFLPLVGPSAANRPSSGNAFWTSLLQYLQSNGGQAVQPDVWNWHMEGGDNNDPIPPAQALPGLVQNYGLTTGIGLQNNEYGAKTQQVPSYSTWFRARYERLKFNGLRGNWASGAALNNLMANLLIRNADGSYATTGEYQAALYYADMGGAPCSTTAGTSIDAYATAAQNNATALVGSQFYTGTVDVVFANVAARFGGATALKASIFNIPYDNGGVVNGWTLSSTQSNVTVSGDRARVSFVAGNGDDAWAVQLSI